MSVSEATMRVVHNPATGDVVGEVRDSRPDEVFEALGRAVAAQKSWARVPRHQRVNIIRRYLRLVDDERAQLATLLSKEQGKPLQQSRAELELHSRLFDGYASRCLAMEENASFLDSQPGLEHDFQFTRREPLGVVAAIVPFNFPVEIYSHKTAPSLVMGNSVVIKPSEETPLTTVRLVELLHDAGVPEDVVQVVIGGPKIGKILSSDERVAAISFTGSTETGTDVATSAARSLKRVILELGGNDALVVLDDADVSLAVREAVSGRTLANGQCCCANKRILIEDRIFDDVSDRLTRRFGELRTGDQLDESTDVGPLITTHAADRVEAQLQSMVRQGAHIELGGERSGAFFSPTVITNVDREMNIARDMEVFGPVMSLIRIDSDQEAVSICNSSRYGLSGSIFSRDVGRAMKMAARMETGQVVINGSGLYRPDSMRFGGYKATGGAREGLSVSLEQYVQVKTISLPGVF